MPLSPSGTDLFFCFFSSKVLRELLQEHKEPQLVAVITVLNVLNIDCSVWLQSKANQLEKPSAYGCDMGHLR